LTTGIPYKEVEKGLNEHRASTGAKLFYTDSNPASYMENVLGFTRVAVPKMPSGARMTVEEFAATHQRGRYVLAVSGHWTSCIDGVIYDTWQCTDESVIAFYKITRFEKTKVEKKYCFTQKREAEDRVSVAVYDGNGNSASGLFTDEAARNYVKKLLDRGYFNFDEMGEFI
jgi:hypothetical protein